MKREKVLKYFRQYGCEIYREGKKHSIIINRVNDRITALPRHPDINDKLVLSLCKDLDIPKIESR